VKRLLLAALALSAVAAAAAETPPLEAVTGAGERVLLHPNGRWEYVDAAKAAAAKKLAEQFPENRVRPVEGQGGWFGIGRVVMPGDPDYNRGSLSPKSR